VLAQFNEVATWFSEILVVDNRSSDDTVNAATRAAAQLPLSVKVVRNNDNYGLGGSHKAAFKYAAENNFDYLVVLHGDDQGSISDLVPLIAAGHHRDVDCLLGARFMPGSRLGGYSRFRTFGNRVFNRLFSLAAGSRLYDLGSGLNLYKVDVLRRAPLHGFSNSLTFNYFMILASAHWKWRIRFFPISWREDDQVSNVKLTRQSMEISKILLQFALSRRSFLEKDHSGRADRDYGFEVVSHNVCGS
jgi:glycosyltransferase involved in cell wall biosynthesis